MDALEIFAEARAQGRDDLAGSRESQQPALEEELRTTSVRFGRRHDLTTTAAWKLYVLSLSEREDRTSHAARLAREHLTWLITANPAELTPSQRSVARRFSRTPDGMFDAAKSRLFGPATDEDGPWH